MTTRRMSGLLAAAGPAAPALQESLDAFKRKHVSQNKEIIHKNSGLMRSNSDLSAKLAGLQEELMAAKAENLELAAANCQLTAKLDVLRAQLKEAHEHIRKNRFTALALPPGHADTFKATLDAVVGQLQNMQALYSASTNAESSSRTYHPISIPDSPESQLGQSTSTSPIPSTSNDTSQASTNAANRPRSSTAIVSAPPDLSLISEGSQEPSLSSSQAGYIPYDDYYGMDEEELQEERDPADRAPSPTTRLERTPSPEIEIRRSPSLSPTPLPPPIPLSTSSISETAARQSRRRNSGVLPPPPRDLAQRKARKNSISETQAAEMLEAPTSPPKKPSLLAELGMSPDSLSLHSIEDLSVRRIRENSPTLVLQEATPPAPQEKLPSTLSDLTRTVRASSNTESLDVLAGSSGLLAPTAASQRNISQRSRNIASKPAGSMESTVKSQKKGPLVGAMQGRPGSTSLISLNGHTVPEGESLKQSKETPAVPTTSEAGKFKIRRQGSAIHRRLSAKLTEPGIQSPTSSTLEASGSSAAPSVLDVGDRTARARSTTPETEPPSITSVLQDVNPASLPQQPTATSDSSKVSKGKNVKDKVSEGSVVKRKMSRESLAGEAAVVSRPRSKSIAKEASMKAKEPEYRETQSQETGSETSITSLSESQENSARGAAAAATGGREGRRARGAVNYQEPSLSKKMRAPAGYVPTIKTVASTRGQHLPVPTVASGVRRKSSLEAMTGRPQGNRRQDTSEGDGSDGSE